MIENTVWLRQKWEEAFADQSHVHVLVSESAFFVRNAQVNYCFVIVKDFEHLQKCLGTGIYIRQVQANEMTGGLAR